MKFPLDVVINKLYTLRIEVVKEPKHPHTLITSVSAFATDSSPANEVLMVSDDSSLLTGGQPALFLIPSNSDRQLRDTIAATVGSDDMVAVTDHSPAYVADQLQQQLIAIMQWNDHLNNLLDQDCVNVDLLRASEPLLQSFVALCDATFSYICTTPRHAPIDDESAYFVEHRRFSSTAIRHIQELGFSQSSRRLDWTTAKSADQTVFGFPALYHPFYRHNRFASLLIMVSPTEVNTYQRFLFEILAKKIDVCLTRHWARENPFEQRYTYFLKEILEGNVPGRSSLEEHASLHQMPVDGIFEVMLIDKTWQAGSVSLLAKRVIGLEPEVKVTFDGNRLTVLLHVKPGRGEQLDAMEKTLFQLTRDLKMNIGLSERFDYLGDAALGLEQARIALEYGKKHFRRYCTGAVSDSLAEVVFRFRRYFPYFALDPFADRAKIIAQMAVAKNPLLKLRRADEEHGTADYELLRVFLMEECRSGAVCERMHLHRNTLAYRLEKIRRLLGETLEDADTRIFLRVLYFIAE